MKPEIQPAVRKATPAYNSAMPPHTEPDTAASDASPQTAVRPALKAQAKNLNFY